ARAFRQKRTRKNRTPANRTLANDSGRLLAASRDRVPEAPVAAAPRVRFARQPNSATGKAHNSQRYRPPHHRTIATMSKATYTVAVVGATGAVGETMLRVLAE